MIGGQHDYRIIDHVIFFEFLEQVFQRVLQLEVAGEVCLDLVRILQPVGLHIFLDHFAVFCTHRIEIKIIVIVTGIGHVVGDERLALLQNDRQGLLHHLQIRRRLLVGREDHADLVRVVIVILLEVALETHVGMGDVALIEVPNVVVEKEGVITESAECVAGAVGEIVIRRGDETGIPLVSGHIRHQTHAKRVLAVGRRVLEACIVVCEFKSLVGQPVEGGRQILGNHKRGEGFRAEFDQIPSAEPSGKTVL